MTEGKPGSRTREAALLMHEAMTETLIADEYNRMGDGMGTRCHEATADYARKQADKLMASDQLPEIAAGEALPDARDTKSLLIAGTMKSTVLSTDASLARTDLLLQESTDCVALALDAALSIKAENSLEKMLAHQMALCHKMAFQTMDKANQQRDTIEQARLINASVRLMTTYQQGMLTLQRIRTGGNQTVTVQHVTVASGGQAVIGNVEAGGVGRSGEVKKNE